MNARLTYFLNFVKGDEACEEMVALVTLPDHITKAEICKAVMNKLLTREIDISKGVSTTKDGVPSKTSQKAGFAYLLAKDVGHRLIGFHCIIRE